MKKLLLILSMFCVANGADLQSTDTLKLVCSSTNADSYQWVQNRVDISGKTDSILALIADSTFYATKKKIHCRITNGAGSTNVGYWYFDKNNNGRVINRKRN